MRHKDDPLPLVTEGETHLTETELLKYRCLNLELVNAQIRHEFYSNEAKRAFDDLVTLQSKAAVMKSNLSAAYGGNGIPAEITVDLETGSITFARSAQPPTEAGEKSAGPEEQCPAT